MCARDNDVETILKASNLELALLEYFPQPTVEQAHALRILNAQLQADMDILRARIERRMKVSL